jgi:hypothetical protein
MKINPKDKEVEEANQRESNELVLSDLDHTAHSLLAFLDHFLIDFICGFVFISLLFSWIFFD